MMNTDINTASAVITFARIDLHAGPAVFYYGDIGTHKRTVCNALITAYAVIVCKNYAIIIPTHSLPHSKTRRTIV